MKQMLHHRALSTGISNTDALFSPVYGDGYDTALDMTYHFRPALRSTSDFLPRLCRSQAVCLREYSALALYGLACLLLFLSTPVSLECQPAIKARYRSSAAIVLT